MLKQSFYFSTLITLLISCSVKSDKIVDQPTPYKIAESKDFKDSIHHHREELAANELYNTKDDANIASEHTLMDFEDFQLVFFEHKSNTAFQYKSGDTILLHEEETRDRLEHFIIFNAKPFAKYSVSIAYEQNITVSKYEFENKDPMDWQIITDFKLLNEHDNLNLHYTLPNYWETDKISHNIETNFEAIKQDILLAEAKTNAKHNAKNTTNLSYLIHLQKKDFLNLEFENNKVFVKIIQEQKNGQIKEFILIINNSWDD